VATSSSSSSLHPSRLQEEKEEIEIELLDPKSSAADAAPTSPAKTMATRYWIVALPVQSADGGSVATAKTALWGRLQDAISRHSFDTPLYRVSLLSSPLP
jgi:hypothetical protein